MLDVMWGVMQDFMRGDIRGVMPCGAFAGVCVNPSGAL
jgi:hypothetical protein